MTAQPTSGRQAFCGRAVSLYQCNNTDRTLMIATRVQRVLKIQMAGVLVGVVVIYEPEQVSFDLLVVSGNGRALSRMCSGGFYLAAERTVRVCLISN